MTYALLSWRPNLSMANPPIPLYFDFIEHPLDNYSNSEPVIFLGFRPKDSYEMHHAYANKANNQS